MQYTLDDALIEEIEKGIAEANRGEFASQSEVEAAFARWTGESQL